MKNADDLRSWSERIKKATRLPGIIEYCDAVIEHLGRRRPKTDEEKKRARTVYMRKFMREKRKREREAKRRPEDMGDFA